MKMECLKLSTKVSLAYTIRINDIQKLKIMKMEHELNYLSEKIEEAEDEIRYYENESRKSESESLRNHWSGCIEKGNTQLELLNNILNVVAEHALKLNNQ